MNLAVIFDCDGVLVNGEVLALEVELAATARIVAPRIDATAQNTNDFLGTVR